MAARRYERDDASPGSGAYYGRRDLEEATAAAAADAADAADADYA